MALLTLKSPSESFFPADSVSAGTISSQSLYSVEVANEMAGSQSHYSPYPQVSWLQP